MNETWEWNIPCVDKDIYWSTNISFIPLYFVLVLIFLAPPDDRKQYNDYAFNIKFRVKIISVVTCSALLDSSHFIDIISYLFLPVDKPAR